MPPRARLILSKLLIWRGASHAPRALSVGNQALRTRARAGAQAHGPLLQLLKSGVKGVRTVSGCRRGWGFDRGRGARETTRVGVYVGVVLQCSREWAPHNGDWIAAWASRRQTATNERARAASAASAPSRRFGGCVFSRRLPSKRPLTSPDPGNTTTLNHFARPICPWHHIASLSSGDAGASDQKNQSLPGFSRPFDEIV